MNYQIPKGWIVEENTEYTSNKQIKRVESTNQYLKNIIVVLKEENGTLRGKAWDSNMELAQKSVELRELVREHDDLRNFLNSLPDDLYKELQKQHKSMRTIDRDMVMER